MGIAGALNTNKLRGELVWLKQSGIESGVRLLAETGTEVIRISISGCVLAGSYPVIGEVIAKVLPVAAEVTTGELAFPYAPILEYWTGDFPMRAHQVVYAVNTNGQRLQITGTEKVSLKSANKFGVFE